MKKLLRLLGLNKRPKLPPQPKPSIGLKHLNPELDLAAFRAEPGLVVSAKELYHTALFQKMRTVVHNHRPRGFPARGQALNDTQANIELGRMLGYEDCLSVLDAMTWAVQADETTNQTPWDYNDNETEETQ
jgi:hypothetical protein